MYRPTIGIGAMDLEILLVAAILRRRIEACRIVRQLALRVEHLDRAEMLGGGGMIEQDQVLDLLADALDLRHHQVAGDVAQRQVIEFDIAADVGIDAGCEIFQSLARELFLAAAHVEHDAGANRGEADHGRDRRRDQQLRRQSPGPAAGVFPNQPFLATSLCRPNSIVRSKPSGMRRICCCGLKRRQRYDNQLTLGCRRRRFFANRHWRHG